MCLSEELGLIIGIYQTEAEEEKALETNLGGRTECEENQGHGHGWRWGHSTVDQKDSMILSSNRDFFFAVKHRHQGQDPRTGSYDQNDGPGHKARLFCHF